MHQVMKRLLMLLLSAMIIACGSNADNVSDNPADQNTITASGGAVSDGGGANNSSGFAGDFSTNLAGTAGQILSSGGNIIDDGVGGNTSTSDGPGIGGGTTYDPGGIGGGSTEDPGIGGGTTEDPGVGGGTTSDGVGGSGTTDDPGVGGGTTDDPGVGGGTTDDPGTGGTTDDPGTGGGSTDDGSGGGSTDDGSGGGSTDDGSGGSGGTDEDCPWVCIPSAIEGVNLLVLNDAFPSGADVEGRMYVGNNAVLPSGYAVNVAGTTASTNDYALVVGNDLTVNGGTVHGTIAFGGEYSGSITATGGITNATPVDFEQLTSDMIYWSDTLAASEPNGTVGGGAGLTLTGTDPDINVFELDASALAAASSLSITVPEGSTVLINVIGTEVSITNMGFSYIGTDSQHVIFNMSQAETVYMSGISLQGTLLAPRADLTFENGNAEGQTIVYNLVSGGGEYHPYYFEGCPWECI